MKSTDEYAKQAEGYLDRAYKVPEGEEPYCFGQATVKAILAVASAIDALPEGFLDLVESFLHGYSSDDE